MSGVGELMMSLALSLHLSLPIVVGGVLHMVVVTRDWWPALKVPVWQRAFGANKTWRGFVAMPFLTIPGVWLAQLLELAYGRWLPLQLSAVNGIVLGVWLGLAYVLLELPNSFIKRRMGVAPGAAPERGANFFIALDQIDSAIGFALVYHWLLGLPWRDTFILIAVFPFVALGVKQLLFLGGLKKSRV